MVIAWCYNLTKPNKSYNFQEIINDRTLTTKQCDPFDPLDIDLKATSSINSLSSDGNTKPLRFENIKASCQMDDFYENDWKPAARKRSLITEYENIHTKLFEYFDSVVKPSQAFERNSFADYVIQELEIEKKKQIPDYKTAFIYVLNEWGSHYGKEALKELFSDVFLVKNCGEKDFLKTFGDELNEEKTKKMLKDSNLFNTWRVGIFFDFIMSL
jgi:hypothetical protein